MVKKKTKTTIGLISKKQLCTCSTLFLYISLPLSCATVTWNFQKVPSYALSWRECRTCSCSLFFHCGSFSPWWPLASRRYKISYCSTTENVSFCFFSLALAPFLVELRWPDALNSLCLCLSLSLYSKFVDMTINLSLILPKKKKSDTETFSAFRCRLYWLFSCVCFTRRGWPYAFPPK